MTRRLSGHGLSRLKRFEGLETSSYRDVAGIWTVGYGHTGPLAGPGMSVTEAEAEATLLRDLRRFERRVDDLVRRDTAQAEFDALVCLAFNIGCSAFAGSTVLKRHNRRVPSSEVAEAFALWNKATVDGRKRVVPGLVRRRMAEAALYASADATAPRLGHEVVR